MTTPQRRVLRPVREARPGDAERERQIARRRARLELERETLGRWMAKLKRAFPETERRQAKVNRRTRVVAA